MVGCLAADEELQLRRFWDLQSLPSGRVAELVLALCICAAESVPAPSRESG